MQIRIKGTLDEIKDFIKFIDKNSPYAIYNSSPIYPSFSGNLYRCEFEVLEINPSDKKVEKCIMPEQPYCPACEYGYIVYPEDADSIYGDCEWYCLYEPNSIDKSGK